VQYADLTVRIFDRPGSDLHGNLEDAPADDVFIIDPDHPPDISPVGVRLAGNLTSTGKPAPAYPAATDAASDRSSCFVFER
jgi:hypothetical protein